MSKREAAEEAQQEFQNPFRPGAGHMPPYLAGRQHERMEFERLLAQDEILENLVLTGLRGIGKTVLLETFKPLAIQKGWLWAGTDLSESTSINEESLSTRVLTDLAVIASSITISPKQAPRYFHRSVEPEQALTFKTLVSIYEETPGLAADKLRAVLELVWTAIEPTGKRGIVFAYDEAQNLADHSENDAYPLSLLLDLFQSIQRKGVRFMLALTGLPTLFPKLVDARTYAERMFRIVFLRPLTQEATQKAVLSPIQDTNCPISFTDDSLTTIWNITRGYPYFVQYVCRESFDVWVQNVQAGKRATPIPVSEIMRKLDSDFFAGRWSRATDRQRDLLLVISTLDNSDREFTVQEIVEQSKTGGLRKAFGSSQVNQMLASLGDAGLIYKNRHGRYSFAVPLMAQFVKRQMGIR